MGGVAGLRPWKDLASDFCYKTRALKTLSRLVQSGRTVIGFDLVEVSPGKHEWDANVGARLLYHLCGVLAAKKR